MQIECIPHPKYLRRNRRECRMFGRVPFCLFRRQHTCPLTSSFSLSSIVRLFSTKCRYCYHLKVWNLKPFPGDWFSFYGGTHVYVHRYFWPHTMYDTNCMCIIQFDHMIMMHAMTHRMIMASLWAEFDWLAQTESLRASSLRLWVRCLEIWQVASLDDQCSTECHTSNYLVRLGHDWSGMQGLPLHELHGALACGTTPGGLRGLPCDTAAVTSCSVWYTQSVSLFRLLR